MSDYLYKQDDKLHCRYSQLVQCTLGNMNRVLDEIDGKNRVETDDMSFGTLRHETFQEDALRTSRPYFAFDVDWPVSHIEQEFVTEIWPGVVLHSRPDLVCSNGILVDYKTVKSNDSENWQNIVDQYRHVNKQRQLMVYAFQLGMHKIRITKGAFLCEVWDKDRETILGYEIVRFPITMFDIAGVLPWVKQRVALLASALESEKILHKDRL